MVKDSGSIPLFLRINVVLNFTSKELRYHRNTQHSTGGSSSYCIRTIENQLFASNFHNKIFDILEFFILQPQNLDSKKYMVVLLMVNSFHNP